jgi:hypothetical protein
MVEVVIGLIIGGAVLLLFLVLLLLRHVHRFTRARAALRSSVALGIGNLRALHGARSLPDDSDARARRLRAI